MEDYKEEIEEIGEEIGYKLDELNDTISHLTQRVKELEYFVGWVKWSLAIVGIVLGISAIKHLFWG